MKAIVLLFSLTFFISPVNAQWVQTNGPEGGNIKSIRVVGSTIFISDLYAGVYKSINNGNTWTKAMNGIAGGFNLSLFTNIAVIGSNLFVGCYLGVYVSSNNGALWTRLNGLPNNFPVQVLAENGTDLFAFLGGSLYLSTNNGVSWALLTTVNSNVATSMVFDGSNIYLGTFNRVFLSTNYGVSWTYASNGLPSTGGAGGEIICMTNIGSNIFAGTMTSGIYNSVNNGASWAPINTPFLSQKITCLKNIGGNLYAGTRNGGLYRSTNSGLTWTPINNGLPNNYISEINLNGSDLLAGTSEAGIFISNNNGISWTWKSKGIVGTIVLSMATMGNYLFAGTSKAGVFSTSDNGVTWSDFNVSLAHTDVLSMTVCGTNLYAGTNNNGVYLSSDSAKTWSVINTSLSSWEVYDLTTFGNNIYAGTYMGNGVSQLINNQSVWTPLSNGLILRDIWSVWAGGTDLVALAGSRIYFSINSGFKWYEVPGSQMILNYRDIIKHNGVLYVANANSGLYSIASNYGSITPITSFPSGWATLLAENGSGLFVSSDKIYASYNNALTWDSMNTGLENQYKKSLIASGQELYAGTWGSGVFTFTLPGPLPVELLSFTGINQDSKNILEWTTASEINNSGFEIERSVDGINFQKIGFIVGKGNSTVQNGYSFIDYFIKHNYYYRLKQIDLDGKYKYSNTIVINQGKNNFVLLSNPSSDLLTIQFLSKYQNVHLEIYSITGQKMYAEELQNINQGYTIEINHNFSAGIYFVKIVKDNTEDVVKILID